eukprot:scaffold1878_cov258-Pinguiococcus_pyrenoidosus.AAC.10
MLAAPKRMVSTRRTRLFGKPHIARQVCGRWKAAPRLVSLWRTCCIALEVCKAGSGKTVQRAGVWIKLCTRARTV